MAEQIFDLRSTPEPLLGGPVTLTMRRAHQQVDFDEVGQRVYATQIIDDDVQLPDESSVPPAGTRSAHGDLAISQVDLSGQVTGVMYVRGFGHGGALGVQNIDGVPWLWTEYDAPETPLGVSTFGRRIARFRFVDGLILDPGDTRVDVYTPVPGSDHNTVSLDLAHEQIGVLFQLNSTYTYAVYDLGRFLNRDFTPKVTVPFEYPEEFQSWTLYGDFIYQFNGLAYSADNPPPPDGQGTSYFTVYDLEAREVSQRVHNLHALDLPRRESESITVWNAAVGPRLVFGYSINTSVPRAMALYAFDARGSQDLTIDATLVDRPVPHIELSTEVGETSTIASWRIDRVVGGNATTLFSGGPASLPATASWNDPAPPPCVNLTYTVVVSRADGTEQTAYSSPVIYVPEGGCGGGGGGPVSDADFTLGCPESYTGQIHWRGGARPFSPASLATMSAVSWSRTLNDTSDATVTVQKQDLTPECCEALGKAEPWVHELTLYRDGELVWQGPIIRITERRSAFVIEAQDVFAWFDQTVNTFKVRYVNTSGDDRGRRRGPVTYIAWNHIRLNLVESSLSQPPDYPGVMDYIVRRDTPNTIKFEKDGSSNTSVWTEYLGDILRELAKRGLTWTTVGRALLLRGRPNSSTRATARLSIDDFAGEVEVIKDGASAATYAFATSQRSPDISDGRTVGTGRRNTAYGRLDRLVRLQEEDASLSDLREAARTALAGRYPVPVAINVPDGSQLSPRALVTLRQLVPGERIDVVSDSICTSIAQGFVLSDVEVTWEAGGERVGITLIPLADIDEELEE